MGRKSEKGKEKRLQRKQERTMRNLAWAVVEKANKLTDPMEQMAAFKKYERNGLSLDIKCLRGIDMDQSTKEWALNLIEDNMKDLYKMSSWGWDTRKKQEEMFDNRAWYLVAHTTDVTHAPVAFVHFRFDLDCDDEVVYCYEVQLEKRVRKKGLGKFLVQILELMAFRFGLIKVMCTVFSFNDDSMEFFQKLKFDTDETSPSTFDEEDYIILSKPIKRSQSALKPQNATT